MTLHDFLVDYGKGEVVWGESDCCAFAAKWVEIKTGCQLVMPAYTSRAEAHRVIAEHGGLVALWNGALRGFFPTSAPQCGDVGIMESRLHGQVGVIVLEGGFVAWRADKGGVKALRPCSLVKAWAI